MSQIFGPEYYKKNRLKLRETFGGDAPIVITGNGLIQRTRDDDVFPFQQEANFWYATGLNQPDAILVLDKKSEYLILPHIDERQLAFVGGVDKNKLAKKSGITEILEYKIGLNRLAKTIKKSKDVATLKPAAVYNETYSVYTNPSQRRLVKILKSYNSSLKMLPLNKSFSQLRVIKTDDEIMAIQNAINHSGKMLEQVSKNYQNYKNEREIQADIEHYRINNSLGNAFSPIVANGKNACTLHYTSNSANIDHKQITLIDTGYTVEGYCSDITRVINKNPSKRQRAVFDVVHSISVYAFSLLKPGVLPLVYEKNVAQFAGEKLRELGLIKTINGEQVHNYFKHRTSHYLGLDVHDVGDYNQPFSENMVITVEPGIYIEKEKTGVRLEDNVLITKEGCKNLSSSLSKRITMDEE